MLGNKPAQLKLATERVCIYRVQFCCLLVPGIIQPSQPQAPSPAIGARQFCWLPQNPHLLLHLTSPVARC